VAKTGLPDFGMASLGSLGERDLLLEAEPLLELVYPSEFFFDEKGLSPAYQGGLPGSVFAETDRPAEKQ
jgi:hypothetical protein